MHKTYGTGRRKTSSARVYLNEGTGSITINSRDVNRQQSQPKLRVIPLGGLHEIGKNTCVFEYGGEIEIQRNC